MIKQTLPEDLQYILAAYGHLVPRNSTITFSAFSALIAETYDKEEPRNAWAIKLCEQVPDLSVTHSHNDKLQITLTK